MSEPGELPEQPIVVVVGGPNGAGKTTSATRFLPQGLSLRHYVNADTIAAGLSAFAPEEVALQAGRVMLARLQELGRSRRSFAFETTLASRTFAPFVRGLRDGNGYEVRVVYVWLQAPELSLQRVAARVARGGHFIPDETVRRRYARGMANYDRLYRPLADTWVLCDNSWSQLQIVARGGRDRETVIEAAEIYDEFQRACEIQRNSGSRQLLGLED